MKKNLQRIEEANIQYQRVNDLESMVSTCFRRPIAGELVKPMLTRDVVKTLAGSFPDLKVNQSTIIKVGNVLKNMQFEQKRIDLGSAYYVVPIKKAA